MAARKGGGRCLPRRFRAIRNTTREIAHGQPKILEGGASGTSSGKAPCGGDHRRTKRNHAASPRHPAGEIEIFKDIPSAKAAQRFECRATHKDRLIAEKPAAEPRARFGQRTS